MTIRHGTGPEAQSVSGSLHPQKGGVKLNGLRLSGAARSLSGCRIPSDISIVRPSELVLVCWTVWRLDQKPEYTSTTPPNCPTNQDQLKLRRPVDGHEHMELAVLGANLGDVDMKIANWI